MINLFDSKKNCCGCTSCMHICPKKAIYMKSDEEGFLYPKINEEKCIECGLCKKVCAFQNGYNNRYSLEEPYIYAVKNKDLDIRMRSRSGGFFMSLAKAVIKESGIVYGAGYKDKFVVCHKGIKNGEDLSELQGSKYVQSDLDKVYADIKSNLRNDIQVLFSGTPCQVAGLYAFLGNNTNTEKLTTIDLVCHGVPTPSIWKDYVEFSEKKYKGKITEVNFRDKEYGWNTHYETFVINDKKYKSNIYTKLFYSHCMLRPSCHNCKYTNFDRVSDITIGDFWGIDKCIPEFDDNKGVSLIIVNTNKGIEKFNKIKSELEYMKSNKFDCMQPQLQEPSHISPSRDKFWQDYNLYGFEYIVKKYIDYSFSRKVKLKIGYILKKVGLFNIVYNIKNNIIFK